MTSAPSNTETAALPEGVRIKRVRSDTQRLRAAQRLVEHARPGDRDAGRLFLANTRTAGISLEHFFASFPPEDPDGSQPTKGLKRSKRDDAYPPARESILIVLGSGRTALLFPSLPETDSRTYELGSVVSRAIDGLPRVDAEGPALAQALLLRSERAAGVALEHAGFTHLAELAYLRKAPLRSSERHAVYEDGSVQGVSVRTVASYSEAERDNVLCDALRASYIETLDCPELQALRETEDVLASHKATGTYDPSLWWVICQNDQPSGVVLVSELESNTEAELVYMGLGPALRGKGLGKRLLGTALAALRSRGIGSFSCAVDLRNTPALRLYQSFDMRPFAERIAYVRDLRGQ